MLLLLPYKWLPRVDRLDGRRALSCANASQKARCVMKLSRLHRRSIIVLILYGEIENRKMIIIIKTLIHRKKLEEKHSNSANQESNF
jgi:hypothetical protein